MRWRETVWIGLALAAGTGCSTAPSDRVTFVFQGRDRPGSEGRFAASTSDPQVMARVRAQLALPREARTLHINGRIAAGRGDNLPPWSWHFVPGEWDLAEASIEVCDGNPELVEADLDYWINTVGRFCPWSSIVVEER